MPLAMLIVGVVVAGAVYAGRNTRTGWADRAMARAKLGDIPTCDGGRNPRLVVELALFETRRLLWHAPLFLVGLAWALAGGSLRQGFVLKIAPLAMIESVGYALGAGTLISVNLAALRNGRDRTDELYGSLAAPGRVRTTAHLLSAVAPAAAGAALIAAALLIKGGIPGRGLASTLALAAQGPLAVIGLGAIGLMLARWVPSVVAGPVAVVVLVASPLIWVLPWVAFGDFPMKWHLAYLVGVAVLFGAVALARDGVRVSRVALASGGLALAVSAALLQIPPSIR